MRHSLGIGNASAGMFYMDTAEITARAYGGVSSALKNIFRKK